MTTGTLMSVAYPFIDWSFVFWTTSRHLLLLIQAFHFSLLNTCATFSGTLSINTTFQYVTILKILHLPFLYYKERETYGINITHYITEGCQTQYGVLNCYTCKTATCWL